MPTHNPPERDPQREHGIASTGQGGPTPGYETSDVKVTGIVVFMVSLFVFVLVFFVFCFGMGKVINAKLVHDDGPPNKWNSFNFVPNVKGKNLESNAAMEQQQLHAMTRRFPTPQLQMDDGNQDLADMHAREDLLLDHYTWVNRQQGTIRMPIGAAMEAIAQRGLPVINSAQAGAPGGNAPAAQQGAMTADAQHQATAPLTNGFARSGYEQQVEVEESRQQQSRKEPKPGEQAQLAAPHP
jgi:hypothetical protein